MNLVFEILRGEHKLRSRGNEYDCYKGKLSVSQQIEKKKERNARK